MDRDAVIQYLSTKKAEFKEKYGVKKIGLFGSFARGQNKEGSDIDIVVELEKPDLLTLVAIKQTIEEELGVRVDIVRNRARMNQLLKKRIEQEAVYA